MKILNHGLTREQWEFLDSVVENPQKASVNTILLECYKDDDDNIKWAIKVMKSRNVKL